MDAEAKLAAECNPCLLAAALLLLMPVAAAEGQEQQASFYVQWYFLTGTSVSECMANCGGACMSTCTSYAASAGMTWNNCGSMCPSACAEKCPEYFAAAAKANDGLPTAPATGCQSQWQCKMAQNPTYAPGTVSEFTEAEPSIPSFTNGQPLDSAGVTNDGEQVESNLPPAGVGVASQTCPDYAPDGHPMRWYDYLGCQDIYWKDHYCAFGGTCDTCTGRQGCIWNGAACIPCNAPSCSYSCVRGGAPVRARQASIPAPAPQAAEAAKEAVRQAQQAGGKQGAAQQGAQSNAGGSQTINPATGAANPVQQQTGPQGAIDAKQQIPAPAPAALDCSRYQNCTTCTGAPKKGNKAQCGWSEFLGQCLDGDQWGAVNASGLKAGWVTDKKYCQAEKEDIYCFRHRDCLSCAGIGGVKRRCQWSENESKCVPYNPLSEFRANESSDANNIIVPGLCPSYSCGDYAECDQCERNAKCMWSKSGKECVEFEGDGTGAYFYPGNCPNGASASAPQLLPSLASCPAGCTCDGQMRPVKCKGAAVNSTGLVPAERAAVNAGAAGNVQQIDGIDFVQAGKSHVYVVRGRRAGALFFVLPVDVNVTATVDAKTGSVQKAEEPWWGFFAR